MSAKIKLNAASGGGSFSLQAPSSSSNNRVFTLPDVADATMATVNGISVGDQWRITSGFTGTTGSFVTSNWERVDTDGYGSLGTGMTESSGVFTFPSTGIYLVHFHFNCYRASGSMEEVLGQIYTTINNSNYDDACRGTTSHHNGGSGINTFGNADLFFVFDVTNTSTHKVKFRVAADSTNVTFDGNSDSNRTYATFIRLGDT